MSEKFAFQQVRGYRRAVDRDERLALAHAMLMQRARNKFFAGSCLAQDQHRRIAVGRKTDCLLHAAHRFAGTDKSALAWPRPLSARMPAAAATR